MSVHSGTLTSRSVHPASPVLLTKNGPLVANHSNAHVQLSNKGFLHIQSLRIEPLRASTRVSSGFALFRHSSPSFGSQQLCSYSNPSEDIRIGRWCTPRGSSHLRSLSLRVWVCHPNTRIDVRLLGPCFKTGRLRPLRQHPSRSAFLSPGWPYSVPGYKTPRRVLPSGNLSPAARADAGPPREGVRRQRQRPTRRARSPRSPRPRESPRAPRVPRIPRCCRPRFFAHVLTEAGWGGTARRSQPVADRRRSGVSPLCDRPPRAGVAMQSGPEHTAANGRPRPADLDERARPPPVRPWWEPSTGPRASWRGRASSPVPAQASRPRDTMPKRTFSEW
ncbi:hypothetical protein VTN49DRAFT_6359 [Thermomyces lanuginosus]